MGTVPKVWWWLAAVLAAVGVVAMAGCGGGSSSTSAEKKGDVPSLLAALHDTDVGIRENAVDALGRIGDRRAVKPLIALYDRPASTFQDETEKLLIADALGRIGDARAVPALVRSATDTYGDPTTDAFAVAERALVAIGKPAVKPLGRTLVVSSKLLDGRGTRCQVALESLGLIGHPSAVPILEKWLNEFDPAIWTWASDAIARIHRAHVPTLLSMLRSPRTAKVYYGLISLGRPGTVNELLAALPKYAQTTGIVDDYLNSGNARLATAANAWAVAHGKTVMGIGGMGEHWGTIK